MLDLIAGAQVHAEAEVPGTLQRLGHHTALADPRLTLDDRHRSRARSRGMFDDGAKASSFARPAHERDL